ncbi:unnamed protein product [Adineta steineri]|uniref:CUB domain-containing protein n=2 Tax=Adineta steineri TaxID=433720 RepID=A0A815QW77_9BILA|nr:unnamed protein product [Adineta steineri]
MYINIVYFIIIFFPSYVYLCNYQLNNSSGTILLPPYDNNIECTWIFNLSLISNHIHFRSLLLTFHHFDTEYGHDELFIGETIPDVSKYNSKLFRFSGSKLPDPCLISLRASNLTRFIWMQFISDKTNTGSGFILDYVFLVNPSVTTRTKSPKLLINANIRHPLDNKSRNIQLSYPYPFGTISSPNYPQNYSDSIICRWNLYHQNAFIRLYIEKFHTELHYDTLTLYLGENLNNRAMILYELSGDDIENKHLFIPNDNLFLIFNTDKSNSASGFFLHYHIIEKEIYTINLYDNEGIIYSNNYPKFLRTNIEYTWNIQMNYSNEIEINLIDIHLDYDQDYLQVITGEIIYTLTSPEIFRVQSINETKIILRTKHSNDDYQYRGFKLAYQILNKTIEINNDLQNLPCGKTYSSHNGTIEFNYEITTIFDCLILIEVDDGQNIFLRFDHINWDNKENYIEIGLFHNPHQNQIFHISDTLPGTWFIANDSQIWIRFYSSQFSLDSSNFRLFYSETIGWSTITPDAYVQILDDNRLFPYRLISLTTNDIYHNLTQAYTWHIEALDDECIQIKFLSLQAFENRRICFHVKDSFKRSEICSTEQFPFVYHHIGSCILSIEPEFIWILVQYNIQIDKFKKITTINEVIFEENNMTLTPSNTLDSYVHIEWLITLNDSSMVIIDVENLDGNTPAKLFIIQDMNTTKSYSLGRISLTRFCHVILSSKSTFKIIYTSLSLPIHNSKRLFRLNLYKISKSYFNNRDFHYISYKKKQTNFQWSIQGQNEKSVFLAKLYSLHKNLSLQTTANVNLSKTNSFIYIPSSNFDVRYNIQNFDFILILYEQQKRNFYQQTILNKTSDLIGTSNFAFYNIHIQSTVFDSIDFIIMKADNGTYIRLYDLSVHNNGYFLLNSSSIITNKVSSLIGLRFSIKSLNIKIELQSLTKNPIQLRYKTQISSIQNKNSRNK